MLARATGESTVVQCFTVPSGKWIRRRGSWIQQLADSFSFQSILFFCFCVIRLYLYTFIFSCLRFRQMNHSFSLCISRRRCIDVPFLFLFNRERETDEMSPTSIRSTNSGNMCSSVLFFSFWTFISPLFFLCWIRVFNARQIAKFCFNADADMTGIIELIVFQKHGFR